VTFCLCVRLRCGQRQELLHGEFGVSRCIFISQHCDGDKETNFDKRLQRQRIFNLEPPPTRFMPPLTTARQEHNKVGQAPIRCFEVLPENDPRSLNIGGRAPSDNLAASNRAHREAERAVRHKYKRRAPESYHSSTLHESSAPARKIGRWKKEVSQRTGRTYYFNTVTGKSQWARPADLTSE